MVKRLGISVFKCAPIRVKIGPHRRWTKPPEAGLSFLVHQLTTYYEMVKIKRFWVGVSHRAVRKMGKIHFITALAIDCDPLSCATHELSHPHIPVAKYEMMGLRAQARHAGGLADAGLA